MLLWSLGEKADFSDTTFAAIFGRAGRKLLALIWSEPSMEVMAPNAIRFVTKTFATNPVASRSLLEKILEEPRFSAHAHEDGASLAEGIPSIAPSDPEFAAQIYTALFGRPAPADAKTWVGGRPSRIMPLVSNAKQDYEHVRWRLRRALPMFLKQAPALATRAVSRSAIGLAAEAYSRIEIKGHSVVVDVGTLVIMEDDRYPQEWRKSQRTRAAPEDEVLGSFADFIADCPDEIFRLVVKTAISEESASSVWARLLGTAAERIGVADDLLWPIACCPAFLEIPGVSRDAVIYLAAVYRQRTAEDRARFETVLLAYISESEKQNWLRSVAARLLSITPDEYLATPQIRQLKAEFEESGKLTGNRPLMSIESGWSETTDFTDRMLTDSGVDLKGGADQELRDATRPLDEALRSSGETLEASQVTSLWDHSSRVVATIARLTDPAPHAESLHASWGSVSNSIDKIVKAEAYDPKLPGHPSTGALLELLDGMSSSPYPEPREESDPDLMGWGNWDIRVYVASALMSLARRFGRTELHIIDRLPKTLRDPASTVRLQIAQSLNTLWEVARPQMWAMIEMVGREERHIGVLGFFVRGPLSRLAWVAPEQVEGVVNQLIAQKTPDDSATKREKRNTFEEAVGAIAAQLWVGRGRSLAKGWIESWTAEPVAGQGYLWTVLAVLRSALFEDFNPKKGLDARGIQDRARVVLHDIAVAGANQLANATPLLLSRDIGEAERQKAEQTFQNGDQLLDHSCNELYFGSGAFEHERKGAAQSGLSNPQDMQRFLQEYQATLEVIGKAGTARTLHHLLELYEFIAAASPGEVFDRVSDLLVGPGAREGYHFESLGSDSLVRLVRRYLADYRFVFDDRDRRAKLVQVLELFSSAGWTDALKLLYDLPDLLR
jgi:hypothetical protein